MNVKIVTKVSNGTSSDDYTSSGFGTPQIALFFCTDTDNLDSFRSDMRFAIGATDGTNEWCVATSSRDGDSSTNGRRVVSNATVIGLLSISSNSWTGEAVFSSWVTDGVRINWTTAPTVDRLITCVLINGLDNAYVGTASSSSTEDASIDITSPGFEPDFLISAFPGLGATNNINNSLTMGIGACVNDGSETQRTFTIYEANGISTSNPRARLTTNRFVQRLSTSTVGSAEVTAFLSNGFTITTRDAADDNDFGYIAGKGVEAALQTIDIPTSTGNEAYTGFGILPTFVLLPHTMLTAVDTTDTTALAGSISVGVIISDNDNTAIGVIQDNVGTTNTDSKIASYPLDLYQHNQTSEARATLVSFDNDGFTLNYSDATSSTRKAFALVLGETALEDRKTIQRGVQIGLQRGIQ